MLTRKFLDLFFNRPIAFELRDTGKQDRTSENVDDIIVNHTLRRHTPIVQY